MKKNVRDYFLWLCIFVSICLIPLHNRAESDSGDLLERANQFFDAARYEEARAYYSQFLTQHPKCYQVHIFIGDCYKATGAYEQAKEEYQKVLGVIAEMEPRIKASLFKSVGDLYLRKENLEIAVDYFNRSLKLNPDPQLAFHLGEVFLTGNLAEESIHFFKQAAAFKADWGDPYLKLGFIYLNTGDSTRAIFNFKKFLELSPDSEQTSAIKGLIKKLSKTLD